APDFPILAGKQTMPGSALAIVLLAAVLHASWNAVVKGAGDRALVIAAVALAHAVAGVALITIAPMPSAQAWMLILLSTLIHYAYYGLLFQAYRLGDLSQVYPIQRGLAPAAVAFGAFLFIGETLSPLGWLGLAATSCGIANWAYQLGCNRADSRAVGVALVVGLTIAGYSFVEGLGLRLVDDSISYMGWLFLLECPVGLLIIGRRRLLRVKM